jgi:hypothetical protein
VAVLIEFDVVELERRNYQRSENRYGTKNYQAYSASSHRLYVGLIQFMLWIDPIGQRCQNRFCKESEKTCRDGAEKGNRKIAV